MPNTPFALQLSALVKPFVGRSPYIYGGTSPTKGIDCSAFSRLVMSHFGVELPRTSRQQARMGKLIPPNQLETGDLVFFSTQRNGIINHVGIYLWQGWFVHSTNPWGVMVSHELGYTHPILFGRRVVKTKE